jgi:hypothetical protein
LKIKAIACEGRRFAFYLSYAVETLQMFMNKQKKRWQKSKKCHFSL